MAPPGALYQFTIVHEALVNFGNAHEALCIAQMNKSGDHPTISNIGSSGNAGAAGPKTAASAQASYTIGCLAKDLRTSGRTGSASPRDRLGGAQTRPENDGVEQQPAAAIEVAAAEVDR